MRWRLRWREIRTCASSSRPDCCRPLPSRERSFESARRGSPDRAWGPACFQRVPAREGAGRPPGGPGATGSRIAVPRVVASLLAACTGERSARQLAGELGDDVFELLDELVERKLVTWTLEIPNSVNDAERYLRCALDKLPDSAPRAAAIAGL